MDAVQPPKRTTRGALYASVLSGGFPVFACAETSGHTKIRTCTQPEGVVLAESNCSNDPDAVSQSARVSRPTGRWRHTADDEAGLVMQRSVIPSHRLPMPAAGLQQIYHMLAPRASHNALLTGLGFRTARGS